MFPRNLVTGNTAFYACHGGHDAAEDAHGTLRVGRRQHLVAVDARPLRHLGCIAVGIVRTSPCILFFFAIVLFTEVLDFEQVDVVGLIAGASGLARLRPDVELNGHGYEVARL